MMGRVWRSFARYLTISLLACAQVVWAQTAKYEGQPIADIQFVPPEQPLTAAELASAIPLKKGAPLRLADVHAAIERLYTTGAFEDIQVDAEPAAAPAIGIIVRIITKNSWFVGNVAMLGRISDPPNAGQLVNVTRLNLGQPFTEADVAPAQDAIGRLLLSNGLHGLRRRLQSLNPRLNRSLRSRRSRHQKDASLDPRGVARELGLIDLHAANFVLHQCH